jgi:hypothetical protein
MNTDLRFDSHELASLKECPAALEWLADYHAERASMAGATGCLSACKWHGMRSTVLHDAALNAQNKLDSGDA